MSFDFKAQSYGKKSRQVLHMTTGGNGEGRQAKYGEQTPAVWIHPSRGLFISSAVGGDPNFVHNIKEPIPALRKWINIEIGQEVQSSILIFYINIDRKKVFSTTNSNSSEFENVQVYTSSRWYPPMSGSIKNLMIENKEDNGRSTFLKIITSKHAQFSEPVCNDWATTFFHPSEHQIEKNSLLTTIPTLAREWRVTFDFNPKSYNNKWTQVLHMTIGGDSGNIGARTPALWMHRTRGVLVSSASQPTAGKFIPGKNPTVNKWAAVEISQIKIGYKYIFSLVINGETLWSVENMRPKEFSNVIVYASSPWSPAQAGSIRRLQIENMLPGEKVL